MSLTVPFIKQEMVQQLAVEADAAFPVLQALPLAQSHALFAQLEAAGVSYVGTPADIHQNSVHKIKANELISELGFPTMPMMALQRSDIETEATFELWRKNFAGWLEENDVDAEIDKIFVKPASGSGGVGVRFARGATEATAAAYSMLMEVLLQS